MAPFCFDFGGNCCPKQCARTALWDLVEIMGFSGNSE